MEGYPLDQELVRQTLAGDVRSFEEIVARHQQAVFRVVYRLLHDKLEAEDVAQEAFIRCYQYLARYDQTRPFAPWLYRIATNLALSKLRRRKKYRMVPLDEISYQIAETDRIGLSPEEIWEEEEAKKDVVMAIKSLKAVDQTIIILRYFEEFSYEEIAGVLRTTRNNVEVRICRARKKLRLILQAERAARQNRGNQEGRLKTCSPAGK